MQVRILSPANLDIAAATVYYERQQPGLGSEFTAEVARAIQRITAYPSSYAQVSGRLRRCKLSRFPFGVLYQVKEQTIIVAAVMHLQRDPSVWQGRV